jgi:hypothetical protein
MRPGDLVRVRKDASLFAHASSFVGISICKETCLGLVVSCGARGTVAEALVMVPDGIRFVGLVWLDQIK